MLPIPATSSLPFMRDLVIQRQRLDFFRRKEEAVSGLAQHSEVPPRIILDDDCQVHLVVEIALDRLYHGDFPFQSQIHDVGALLRPEAHAISSLHRDSEDCDAFERRVFRHLVPLHHALSFAAEFPLCAGSARDRPRIVPCVLINCSRAFCSVRSRRLRTWSSASRISCFSWSVRVITRKVSISSISVASKKSPALSGAICG